MIWGMDYLAGVRYAKLVLAEHPGGWAAGFFARTFGDARPLVKALFETGRVPVQRVHLLWRDNHDYGEAQIREAVNEAKRWRELSREWKAWLQISPWCEHTEQMPLLERLRYAVMDVLPDCDYVNTPMPGGALLHTTLNEIHGERPALDGHYNFSFDGTPCVDCDMEEYKKRHASAEIFFFWDARFNLRWEETDTTPRPERTDPRRKPDSGLIDSIIYLNHERGVVDLPPKWIYKTHSENKGPDKQGNLDPRAEKPLMISPKRAKEIRLVAAGGQVVETLKYYGPYSGGGFRYYSEHHTWGYQSAEKAKRIQGHPLVRVLLGNAEPYGIINPAFRFPGR